MASAPQALLLDVMDTLVHDPFRPAIEAACGHPVEEVLRRRDPTVYPAFERGEVDETAYWDHYTAAGFEANPEVFHRERRAGTRWIAGMAELLDELAGTVQRVAASNYPVWIEELERDTLRGRIDAVVASCHIGVRKPDRAFYTTLLERLGLDAQDVLFVDDRQVNVAAAREVGIRSHRFVDAPTLRDWLGRHGLTLAAG